MRPKFNNIGKSPQNTVYCILDIRPRWMSLALGLLFFFTMAILTRDFCLFALKNEHFWLEPKCSANACMSMPYNITITQHFLWERDVILVLENHNIVQLQESTYTIGAQIYILNIFCLVGLLCCNFVQNESNYFILNPFSTLHSLVFSKGICEVLVTGRDFYHAGLCTIASLGLPSSQLDAANSTYLTFTL